MMMMMMIIIHVPVEDDLVHLMWSVDCLNGLHSTVFRRRES